MIEIPLRNRAKVVIAVALVDEADSELADHRWCLSPYGYAMRRFHHGSVGRTVYLHREILGLVSGDRRQGDHINRDRLDNRRENLRIVTSAGNHQNRTSARGSSSRHLGVSWYRRTGKWRAAVKVDGRSFHLGFFSDEDEAGAVAAAFRRQHMPYAT